MATTIEEKLKDRFGKDDIKISIETQPFPLTMKRKEFLPGKKDVQIYVCGNDLVLESISAFSKNSESNLLEILSNSYFHGELSATPTHVICVLGARNTTERNADGTFNAQIYELTKEQRDKITEDSDLQKEIWNEEDNNLVEGIKQDPHSPGDYIQYGD